MHLLIVCPELPPFGHAGDHGEIVGALARAQRREGFDVTVVTPLSSDVSIDRHGIARRLEPLQLPGEEGPVAVAILEGKFPSSDARVIFVEHLAFDSAAAADPAAGFACWHMLAESVIALVDHFGWSPDVLHGFGWQTGAVPLLAKLRRPAGLAETVTVYTAFDPAQLGLFDSSLLQRHGIGYDLFHPDGIEFHGQVSLHKAAMVCADAITLPGPSCVDEVQQEPLGFGLHGLYARLADRTYSIPSGIDTESDNPESDQRLPARYRADDLTGKGTCKRSAQLLLGLKTTTKAPLLLITGRLLDSVGMDLVLDTSQEWLAMDVQLAIVGECDAGRSTRIAELAGQHPETVVHHRPVAGADDQRLLLAGADAILLPASRETGHLQHLRALRYGTIPIARAVGSLRDSLVDFDRASLTGTSIRFADLDRASLLAAMRRLLSAYRSPTRWRALVANAMRQNWSARVSARRLAQVYQAGAAAKKAEAEPLHS